MARLLVRKTAVLTGGVDPGKHGFLVAADARGPVRSDPIPYVGSRIDRARLHTILRSWKLAGVALVYVEHQQAFGREHPKAVWTAAENYGVLLAILHSEGLPFREVPPSEWKPAAGIPSARLAGLPRLPKEPARGSPRPVLERWKVERDRAVASRRGMKKRHQEGVKQRTISRAQARAPGYDFRARVGDDEPSDAKCEGFLLAQLARRELPGGSGA